MYVEKFGTESKKVIISRGEGEGGGGFSDTCMHIIIPTHYF